mmetsp:Transcript_26101/g.63401  ORF Transcript_26101/g.63401 Transcript_26101/m.63401 type:complete len:286 (-) Transcript_26101:165-1022(-)
MKDCTPRVSAAAATTTTTAADATTTTTTTITTTTTTASIIIIHTSSSGGGGSSSTSSNGSCGSGNSSSSDDDDDDPSAINVGQRAAASLHARRAPFGAVCGIDMSEFDEGFVGVQQPPRLPKHGLKRLSYVGATNATLSALESNNVAATGSAFCAVAENAGGVVMARATESDGFDTGTDALVYAAPAANGTYLMLFERRVHAAAVELVGFEDGTQLEFVAGTYSSWASTIRGAAAAVTVADANGARGSVFTIAAHGGTFDALGITLPEGGTGCVAAVGVSCKELH